LKAKTVADKHLAAVRALLRWAFDNARLPTNEAEKVIQKVPKKGKSREVGYTLREATRILTVSLAYQPAQAAKSANRESVHITAAKKWIPLLCAFTGARVTELGQLRKEDFRMEVKRWVIRITPDAGSVKSDEYRDVPLHRQVIALGFIDFVNAAADGPLFHGAKVQKGESAEQSRQRFKRNARTTSGRISEWLHELNLVPNGVQPSHGWRHKFKTQGLELGVSNRVLDCIQGHAEPGSGSDYGDVTITAMLHVIDAMPDYDLAAARDAVE
jgi:integrase